MAGLRRVLCLFGPTAVGKTDIAIAIAKQQPVDLISVDSTLVYRGMNIGSAKPDEETLRAFPHQLVDVRDPVEGYSTAEFLKAADAAVEQAFAHNRLPILVGGTMLYFRAFRDGLADLPSADEKLRAQIQARGDEVGWQVLFDELLQLDPLAAARIHPNNHRRIVRALEVLQLTQQPLSAAWEKQRGVAQRLKCQMLPVALLPPSRQLLHKRIEARFMAMLDAGLVEEVRDLIRQVGELVPALRSVGYFEVWQFLHGEYDQAEMQKRGIAASRQLAKKQLTWLNDWPDIHKVTVNSVAHATAAILQYMDSIAIISGPLGES